MDDTEAYNHYWEMIKWILETEEHDRLGFDDVISTGSYDSSSPDNNLSSFPASYPPAEKNTVALERNRRKKLTERLYRLRSVVPKISKMDKASTIKDAIDYIQELQEQERRLTAEVSELEYNYKEQTFASEIIQNDSDLDNYNTRTQEKKRIRISSLAPNSPGKPCIEILELRVSEMRGGTLVISVSCIKKRNTLLKLAELFESLNLKIMSANITTLSGTLLHTLFVETDEMNSMRLKEKIETAIAEYDSRVL